MASRNARRSPLVRYVPFIVVVILLVGVGVVIAVTGGGGDDRDDDGAPTGDGPLTFEEAKAQGVDTSGWQDCDQDNGRVAIPWVYAAPCVEPFTGDNGGATAPGVTGDEIKVVAYVSDPARDPLISAFFSDAAIDNDPAKVEQTFQGYVDLLSQYYETYGRKVTLEFFLGSGGFADEVAAKADAIKIATELKPFAVWGGPAQSQAFADELAARGIICLQACATALPDGFLQEREPYVWSYGPTPEEASVHAVEMIGKQLVGKPAQWAGDEEMQDRERVFGSVHYDAPDGRYKISHEQLVSDLRTKYDTELAVDRSFFLDLTQSPEDARGIVAALKDADVTTVIYSGDPIMPSFLTREATAQGYFPEWVITTTVYADTSVFARTYDQEQWAHAFGLSLPSARGVQSVQASYQLWSWQYCTPPPANTYNVLIQGPMQFFTGVHLAGPDLTPQTFQEGMFRYPPSGGNPTNSLLSWGRHDIWPNLDLGGTDDAATLWWDPTATGTDENGTEGTGLYRYPDDARRYRPEDWPSDPIPFFEVEGSVAIFETLPPDAVVPAYPSPCGEPSDQPTATTTAPAG